MNPGTTFVKTDKGKVEMAERSGNLTAVQRRLLILIHEASLTYRNVLFLWKSPQTRKAISKRRDDIFDRDCTR